MHTNSRMQYTEHRPSPDKGKNGLHDVCIFLRERKQMTTSTDCTCINAFVLLGLSRLQIVLWAVLFHTITGLGFGLWT